MITTNEDVWDSLTDETEVFIPIHKSQENGEPKVVLLVDNTNTQNVGEVRVFLTDEEMKNYLAQTNKKEVAYVRYSILKLNKSMNVLLSKKADLRLNVVLYTLDITKKLYPVETLWTYLSI
jgi:hypothetical protein